MRTYDDGYVSDLLTMADITEVISPYVELEDMGEGILAGKCPFHEDESGCFIVDTDRQTYSCLECGESGNAISFIQAMEHLSFGKAVETLADRCGISLPIQGPDEDYAQKERDRNLILAVNRSAQDFYVRKIRTASGRDGLDYFHKRGLSDETIRDFGLGYAGKFRDDLLSSLKKSGYSEAELLRCGIFGTGEYGIYDKFSGRAIFPIKDVEGTVIGFGGRYLGDSKLVAKYLNSPETAVFQKGENLYALDRAKSSPDDFFLLCEGYMDVIALHQAGFRNAVASLGTALTEHQAERMSRYKHKAVLTYDSDDAGVKAATRAIPILEAAGFEVRVLGMSPYKDPDEFIKGLGAAEYRKRIDEAVPARDFILESFGRQFAADGKDGRDALLTRLASAASGITDRDERCAYARKAAAKFGLDADEILYESGVLTGDFYGVGLGKAEEIPAYEKSLLLLFASDADVFTKVSPLLSDYEFTGGAQTAFREISKEYGMYGFVDEGLFFDGTGMEFTALVPEDTEPIGNMQELVKAVRGIKTSANERAMKEAAELRDGDELLRLIANESVIKKACAELQRMDIDFPERCEDIEL